MQLAKRMSKIKPSATLAINAKALELKAQGIAVTSLAVGEPDFPTPAHICKAAKKAIDEGFTRYTAVPGILELRKAAAGYFNRVYGVEAPFESIIITNGGKQSLYNLLQAIINPGDEVLIPAPYWVSYPDLVYMADGEPVGVLAPATKNFKITVADLEQHRTPKTRALILNSPSNPTGACYTRAEIDTIMQWAIDKNLFVIADEIYDQLVYAPAKPVSVISWWQRYPEQVAITNGLAKSFAMTGWRVGYTLANPQIIKAMSQIQGQSTANVCSIAQKAGVAALTGPYDCVAEMRVAFQRRRDLVLNEISTWEGVVCPKPDGAFYVFMDISALFTPVLPDAAAVCTLLLEKAQVALVPGDAFGAPGCMRMSYALSDEVLVQALTRMRAVLYK